MVRLVQSARIERVERQSIQIVIEVRQHQNIGGYMGDDRLDRDNLRIVCFNNVAQQKTGTVPTERGGEGRNT